MASTNNYDLQFISFDKLPDETPSNLTANATNEEVSANISDLIDLSVYFVGYKPHNDQLDINRECRVNASTTLGYILSSLYNHIYNLEQITTLPNNIITNTTVGHLKQGTDISGWSVASVLTAILCSPITIIKPKCQIHSNTYIHYIEEGLDISTIPDFYGVYTEGKVPLYSDRTTTNYSGGIDSAYFKYNDITINVKEDYNKSPSAGNEVKIYPKSTSKITLTPGDNEIAFYVKYKAGENIYNPTDNIYESVPAATISSTSNKINGTYRIYTKSGDTYTLQPKPTKYKNTVELNLEKHEGYKGKKAGFAIHESLSIASIECWEAAFNSWQTVTYKYTNTNTYIQDGYIYNVYECNVTGNMGACKLQIKFN